MVRVKCQSVSQCSVSECQCPKGRTRFAKLQSMRLDQGVLPGRCDQACEWLAKLAGAHPRRLLLQWQNCAGSRKAAGLLGGGKAGVIRLVGFTSTEWEGMTGCGCTVKMVRTEPRYRQLTPATLLNPHFLCAGSLPQPASPGRETSQLPLSVSNR